MGVEKLGTGFEPSPKKIKLILPEVLKKEEIDLWLILTREESRDPIAKDFGAGKAVARTALLFYLKGDQLYSKAIAASYDITPLKESNIYDEIVIYREEGIKKHLREEIKEVNPQKIAINYSRDVPIADGLSYGMYNYLKEAIGGEMMSRTVSAEPIIVAFRSTKLPEEIEIIQEAVHITENILAEVLKKDVIKVGEMSEKDLAEYMKKKTKEKGAEVEFVSINVGETRGHSDPTDLKINKGDLLRVDFGIRYKGYTTDLQRCAYLLKEREEDAPSEIKEMFEITRKANRAAFEALKPGARGIDVDTAARKVIIEAGYKEYPHATGHPIGLEVHDVGPMLGPDWKERYGSSVIQKIQEGQTFAIEPMVYAFYEPYGGEIHISLEEDVVVLKDGAKYLSHPQEELILI